MSMTRELLLKKLADANPNIKNSDIVNWVMALPSNVSKIEPPNKIKVGDVFMHPVFQHPYIILNIKGDSYVCCLLTTEPTFSEILEACDSRFFSTSFITKTLLTVGVDANLKHTFYGVYENNKHLKKAYEMLVESLSK